MIERFVHGGVGPTHPPKVAPSIGVLDQWMGNAQMAEPIEMLFRGLTHAG